jgi:hypothetical protein
MLLGSSTGGIPGNASANPDDVGLDGGALVGGADEVVGPMVAGALVDVPGGGPVGVDESFAAGWLDVQPASRPATASRLTAAARGLVFITWWFSYASRQISTTS